MEETIFISKLENLKYVNSRYTRLYFGNEFCQRLIPSLEDIKVVTDFVLRLKMQFTFVTPYVTDRGIEMLKPIVAFLMRLLPKTEFVINDWGVLRLIEKEFHCSNLCLGRLLTKQKKGPRILKLKKIISQTAIQHFRESNVDTPLLRDFLISRRINRVELDNLLQGISRKSASLKASLYFPFAYVTTTRFCLAASSEIKREFLRSIPICKKECQKYTFRLHHKNMPVDLFLKGNTQFFMNKHLPENLEELNIDRLVYQPEIPL